MLGENKKAKFNYFIEEILECGVVLKGSEVKSLKARKFSFNDSFAAIIKDELWLLNLHISKYKESTINNHSELRKRKLLVKKREIEKLKKFREKEGYSLVPIKIYLKNNLIKISLGICKGKKLHDKREVLKTKAIKKELSRDLKLK